MNNAVDKTGRGQEMRVFGAGDCSGEDAVGIYPFYLGLAVVQM